MRANHNIWQINEDQEYHEEVIIEPDQEAVLIKTLSSSLARIDKLGFATALGSISGLIIFIITLLSVIKDDEVTTHGLNLLNQYFYGYTVSVKGAFIGLAYSFFWGFLFGWLFAYIRNLYIAFFIYRAKKKKEMLYFKDFMDHF
jgi:hypothetical protein